VISGIGLTFALLALLVGVDLVIAIVVAAQIAGHWGDVLRIALVCSVVSILGVALIRVGRRETGQNAQEWD
jgi:hypothetical protein